MVTGAHTGEIIICAQTESRKPSTHECDAALRDTLVTSHMPADTCAPIRFFAQFATALYINTSCVAAAQRLLLPTGLVGVGFLWRELPYVFSNIIGNAWGYVARTGTGHLVRPCTPMPLVTNGPGGYEESQASNAGCYNFPTVTNQTKVDKHPTENSMALQSPPSVASSKLVLSRSVSFSLLQFLSPHYVYAERHNSDAEYRDARLAVHAPTSSHYCASLPPASHQDNHLSWPAQAQSSAIIQDAPSVFSRQKQCDITCRRCDGRRRLPCNRRDPITMHCRDRQGGNPELNRKTTGELHGMMIASSRPVGTSELQATRLDPGSGDPC